MNSEGEIEEFQDSLARVCVWCFGRGKVNGKDCRCEEEDEDS